MFKPLRPLRDLLRLGWSDFTLQWNQTLLISSWLLFAPLLLLAVVLMTQTLSENQTTWLTIIINILQALITLWITVRIVKWFLAELHQDKSHAHEYENIGALKALPHLIWVSILKSLATLGGLALAFFPGMWLNTLFSMSELAYLEDRKTGVDALRFSANLIKGRWWATFGRMLGITVSWLVLYLGLYLTVSYLVFAISGFNPDPNQIKLLTDPSMLHQALIIDSADNIIHALCQIVLIPLLFAWQIRLYKNLKDTSL